MNNLNIATNTRWIVEIPFYQISEELSPGTEQFNLTTFTIPETSISSTTVSYQGYSYEIPTNVNEADKTLSLDYILQSDWRQYLILWKWVYKIINQIGTGRPDETPDGDLMVPVHITLLSEFNKPIFSLTFHDAWIKTFGAVSVDYQDAESSPIVHNFALAYSRIEPRDIKGL